MFQRWRGRLLLSAKDNEDAINEHRGDGRGAEFLNEHATTDFSKPSCFHMRRAGIRPALERIGVKKQIGWHSFRHSLGTMLRQKGVDVKTAQELLDMLIAERPRICTSSLFPRKRGGPKK